MVTNQVLQNTVNEIKGIARVELGIVDLEQNVIAATFDCKEEVKEEDITYFISSGAESQMIYGYHYFKIYDETTLEYILIVKGGMEDVYMIGRLAVSQIRALMMAYKENLNKIGFVQNILLDNLAPADIYSTAQKLDISVSCRRIVILVETDVKDTERLQKRLQKLASKARAAYAIVLNETMVAILKEMQQEEDYNVLEQQIQDLQNVFAKEQILAEHIAYGTVVTDLQEVAKSYKEAMTALEIGKIFYKNRIIVSYSALGIGRLIYQIPKPLCEMYVKEVLREEEKGVFDEEMLSTIHSFFENNLNMAETARKLFVHRNTLAYRLEKLKLHTGLDIREFEDAMTLKIALMVMEYLNYNLLTTNT